MRSTGEGVLILGGGLAGQRCAETLRRGGYGGRVRIVCGEPHRPYSRPPLSKDLLVADGVPAPSLRAEDWYRAHAVELILGRRAQALDPRRARVLLEDGRELAYEQLVIATGSKPRRLPRFEGYANVGFLRTLEDARRLRTLIAEQRRIVVIGAGFIGQEVAGSVRSCGGEITVVELERLPLVGLLGPELGRWFADLHTANGVELLLSQRIDGVRGARSIEALELAGGRDLACDHVLVGVGVVPDLDWLEPTGLGDSGGIPVDWAGRTCIPSIYAAGDAAAWFDPVLDRHALSGHWEAASRQGMAVAQSILGEDPAPPRPASFWSDQYGVRIQYLGQAQLADSVSIDGELASNDFMATYTRDGQLVAAVTVGRPGAVAEIRERLEQSRERALA
jgi:NADPH-dependent 2,4-dienoyl-CoA reductase/sulfur reductase-like enzyme